MVRETIRKDGYRIESVTYEVEPGDRDAGVCCWCPTASTPSHPAPAVAVWHQHNGEWHLGKVEPAGLAGNPMHHTGVALAKEGYVVLCPDALCFGERQSKHLQRRQLRAVRVPPLRRRRQVHGLEEHPRHAPGDRLPVLAAGGAGQDRIGCYGHSMGSTHTWLVGPWEPRLKCLVGNCCLPTYAAIHRTHILHCFPNFIPGWFQYGDTPDIAGLIAPRALHLNFGETDGGSPIEEVREGVKTIARAYEQAGAPEQVQPLHRARRRPRPLRRDVAPDPRLVPQASVIRVAGHARSHVAFATSKHIVTRGLRTHPTNYKQPKVVLFPELNGKSLSLDSIQSA